jgi:cytochrome c-type biogenesis protein CcmH
MLWVVIGVIALASLIALAWPLFSARSETATPDETDYLAAQLDDVERERALGALSDSEAETARLEAKRRLLAAGRTRRETAAPGETGAILRQAAMMGVGAIPLAAMALYLGIGAPERTSSTPSVQRAAAPVADERARPIGDVIAGLEQRLAADPSDIEGWLMLGESQGALGRYAEAANAFRKAAALDPNSAFLEAALAESLILENNGAVGEEADAALERALALDPKEPRARYYSAQKVWQAGDRAEAVRMIAALVNDAAPDAPWLPIAQNELVTKAMEAGMTLEEAGLGEDASARLQRAMAADVARAEGTPALADAAALEASIASGDAPYTDWIDLADAYAAAGDDAKAADTIARARERYAAAPFVLQEIAKAEARLSGATGEPAPARRGPTAEQIEAAQSLSPDEQQAMIEGMVSGLAARLEANPDDPEGWLMLGRSYGVLGDYAKSAEAFARAATLRPADISVQLSYAQSLLAQAEAAREPIDSKTEEILTRVLELDANQTFALYYLGLAARQENDKANAKRHWERLASLLPAGSEDAKRIGELLDSLE